MVKRRSVKSHSTVVISNGSDNGSVRARNPLSAFAPRSQTGPPQYLYPNSAVFLVHESFNPGAFAEGSPSRGKR